MPLPVDYDTVEVRGKYTYLDGTPVSGKIRFTGKVVAISDATDTIILPASITASLVAGQFSVNLPATDDPDIQPNGWTYTVTEEFSGGRVYEIDVPLSAKATGIELSEVAPVIPSTGTPTAYVTLTQFLSHTDPNKSGYVNVKSYGAMGDGVTNDTAAISNAIADLPADGGTVYFPAGTYIVSQSIPIRTHVHYVGAGVGSTTVKAANGSNVDVFKTEGFDVLWPGTAEDGPVEWSLRHMTIDGNAGQQTSGYPLSIYGRNYELTSLSITGGKSGGIRSKWAWGGTNMESRIRDLKVWNNFGLQFDWQGPHDSQFQNLIIFTDYGFHGGLAVPGSRAIRISGVTAGGEQFNNLHIWGYHEIGFHVSNTSNGDVKVYNGTSEGAQLNVWLDNDLCIWDGTVYCTNGVGPYAGTEVGIRVGTEPGATRWMNRVRGTVWNHATGDKPIYLAGDDGNDIDCNVRIDNATAAIFYRTGVSGPSFRSRVNIICPDNRQHAVSTQGFGGNGAPPNELGIVGSYYHRWDGTTGSRIYHKTGPLAWTAIL